MPNQQNHNHLQRKLGPFSLTNLVIANMIGTGIFTTSGLIMQNLHHPLLMIGLWVIAGIIALSGALCYAQLGTVFPQAGGEYIFLSRLYHPLLGFLTGWISFVVGFSAPIAASSLAASSYVIRACPHLMEMAHIFGIQESGLLIKIFALIIILTLTAVHVGGVSFGTRIQNGLTLLKIIFIIGLLLAGFLWGQGDLAHFIPQESFSFNLSGWRMNRNLPLSLILGTMVVTGLYLALNVLFVYAVPPAEMEGVLAIGGLAVRYLFGSSLETYFSLFIALALLSSISAFIILGPRIYYAMAREGYFFRFAAKVGSSSHTPFLAIIIQSALAAIMVLTGTFDQILTYIGFSLGIFPILAVLSVFKLKKHFSTKFFLPAYPLPPILFASVSIIILTLTFMQRPVESGIASGVVLAGIPAYLLFKKKNLQKHL
ncbi:MAG: amino acid permease [bacterium]